MKQSQEVLSTTTVSCTKAVARWGTRGSTGSTLRRSVLLITTLTLFIIVTTLLHTTTSTVPRRHQHSPNMTTSVCTFITPPNKAWSYNSRSFCTFPKACITTSLHASTTPQPLCMYTTSTLQPYTHSHPCTHTELSRIICAFSPNCTAPQPLPSPTADHNIYHPRAIIVPAYPYPANIFHFSNIITTILHIVTNHPNIATIILTTRPTRNQWQAHFQRIVFDHLKHRNPHLNIIYHTPSNTTCTRDAIVLGGRGHVNLWPFTNTTPVTPFAKQIPTDSILLRHIFYTAYNIPHQLPIQALLTAPPPLILGYSRRLGPGADTGSNIHQIGTLRRFSQSDETWFQAMLHQQTALHGVQLRIFATTSTDSLKEQVSNFATLGACIGIHGANLVNTMFMPPLSALVEIFPARVTSQCYFAGANSGLRYFRVESRHPATAEESGCFEGRCLILRRQRRVMMDSRVDRLRVTKAVNDALTYLVHLRKQFPGGVPLEKDPVNGVYRVV